MNFWVYVVIILMGSGAMSDQIPASQQDVIKQLISLWTNLPSNWKVDDVANACNFTGITCDQGELLAIELDQMGIEGPLPAILANLTDLQLLSMKGNRLHGGLPTVYSDSLLHLILASNNLDGTLPSELGNNGLLFSLDLYGNKFSGCIPESFTNFKYLGELGYCSLGLNHWNCTNPSCMKYLPARCANPCHHEVIPGKELLKTWQLAVIVGGSVVFGLLVGLLIQWLRMRRGSYQRI